MAKNELLATGKDFPHVRGGEPDFLAKSLNVFTFSPRAWG